MSFTNSFEKTAGVFSGIGSALGKPLGALGGIGAKVKKNFGMAGKEIKKGLSEASTSTKRSVLRKPEVGAGLAAAKNTETSAAKEAVLERAKRLNEHKQKNKPSWAARNPIKAGIGAYAGARLAFGGDDKKEDPAPQVYNNRQY
jgi:uncharacterized protein YaiL (DUF2058 family)